MCIIAYIPKDTEIKKEVLENCFSNNKDGAGFMYQKKDEVFIQKGFMTFAKFWEAWETTPSDVDRVAHFRIATAGKVSAGCCHPFPVVENYNDMRRAKCYSDVAIAHNGILSLYNPEGRMQADYSDTMMFIQMTLHPLRSQLHKIAIQNLILETGSKFAIMTKDKVTMVGNFEQSEGCFFSNSTYKTSRTSYLADYNRFDYTAGYRTKKYKTTFTKMQELAEVYDMLVFEHYTKGKSAINFILEMEDNFVSDRIEPENVIVPESGVVYWAASSVDISDDFTVGGYSCRLMEAKDLASSKVRNWVEDLHDDLCFSDDDSYEQWRGYNYEGKS